MSETTIIRFHNVATNTTHLLLKPHDLSKNMIVNWKSEYTFKYASLPGHDA